MPSPVGFILKGWPRLSETFIAQEIAALEALGLELRLISLRHPTDSARHPVHASIRAPVRYLPEYLYQEPLRVLRGWRSARRLPGWPAARRAWIADLRRDFTPNRVRRFGQALVLAAELEPEVEWLHAHFLHTPASVTRYAAILRGLPFSISAHAKDIWTSPDWEKSEKLADCRWAVTCTESGARHLAALAPAGRVDLVYHGLDLARFPPHPGPLPARDGSDPANPAIVLSVGRAVAKKGFDDLLQALARLPPDLHWRLRHVGGGQLRGELRRQAEALGLAERIDWLGPRPQPDVLEELRRADLFVLASRVAEDGDRDGLPNVLMEAQSQSLACLATRAGAIAELIEDGVGGVLVPPRDPPALAGAMETLIRDPARRHRLAAAGRARLLAAFDSASGIARLAARFGLAAPARRAAGG